MDERIENAVPLKEGMWAVHDGKVFLLGSVCDTCGEVYFPPKEVNVCSHCQGEQLHTVEFSNEGTVYSFSEVHQPPAGGFYKGTVPFIYGLVEFPEGVIVQGHILADVENLKIGDRVETVLDILCEGEEGPVSVYKFKKI